MTRKRKIAEIISNALYNDNPELYLVGYIDFSTTRETTLEKFLELAENFETVPASRIVYIKKENDYYIPESLAKKIPRPRRILKIS